MRKKKKQEELKNLEKLEERAPAGNTADKSPFFPEFEKDWKEINLSDLKNVVPVKFGELKKEKTENLKAGEPVKTGFSEEKNTKEKDAKTEEKNTVGRDAKTEGKNMKPGEPIKFD